MPAHPRMSKLIVSAAFVGIGKDFVRLSALLELRFRDRLIPIRAIGMIFHRQLAITATDLLSVRIAGDAEHFVIIAFDGGHDDDYIPAINSSTVRLAARISVLSVPRATSLWSGTERVTSSPGLMRIIWLECCR